MIGSKISFRKIVKAVGHSKGMGAMKIYQFVGTFSLLLLSSCAAQSIECPAGERLRMKGEGTIVESCLVEREKGHKVQQGPMLVYDYHGRLVAEGYLVNNELHGRYRSWGGNGRLASEGYYDHGKMQGTWTYWDDNGNIKKIEHYDDGVLLDGSDHKKEKPN